MVDRRSGLLAELRPLDGQGIGVMTERFETDIDDLCSALTDAGPGDCGHRGSLIRRSAPPAVESDRVLDLTLSEPGQADRRSHSAAVHESVRGCPRVPKCLNLD